MLLLLVVALLGAAAAQTPVTYGSVYYENGQYEVRSLSPPSSSSSSSVSCIHHAIDKAIPTPTMTQTSISRLL